MKFIQYLFLIGLLASSGRVEAGSVAELKVAYLEKVLRAREERETVVDKLATGYETALAKAQSNYQKAGRLADVLSVKNERELLSNQSWPFPPLTEATPPDVVRLRKIYEKSRIETERTYAETRATMGERMKELLQNATVSLTKEGKIAEAELAQKELKAVINDPELKQSRDFLARVKNNQEAPPAIRLRRSGDDLEVMVRYDRQGEISMDSPVENLLEITTSQREKGDTKATLLGEFLGAEGYQADTFTIFDHQFDEKLPARVIGSSLSIEGGHKIEGREAMRILMGPKAKNPRLEIADLLPAGKGTSTYQLEFSYLIPKENKSMTGFAFHQGFAAPIVEEQLGKKGAWVDETLVSPSLNEHRYLRLYFEGLAGNGEFNGGNESIYLDGLKVSYRSFSGQVVSTYDENGVESDPTIDPAKQKTIAHSGKLLPNSF